MRWQGRGWKQVEARAWTDAWSKGGLAWKEPSVGQNVWKGPRLPKKRSVSGKAEQKEEKKRLSGEA